MQNTGRSSRRWLQGLGAAVLLLALTTPAWAIQTCATIGGVSAAGTCTLSALFNLTALADRDVVIGEHLVIAAPTGELRYGNTIGTLSVTGDLTIDAGRLITANGGAGQAGGNVTITVSGNAVVNGSITATGGGGTGGPTPIPAGTGGALTLAVTVDLTANGIITANGGVAGSAPNAGGAGGSVTMTANNVTVAGTGTVAANGANGANGSGADVNGGAGGAGGSVSATVTDNLNVSNSSSSITANGGNGGTGKDSASVLPPGGPGGDGGTAGVVQLAAGGDFVNDGTVAANAGNGGVGGNGNNVSGNNSDSGSNGGNGGVGGGASGSVPNGVAIGAITVDIGATGVVSANGGKGGNGGAGGNKATNNAQPGNGGTGGNGNVGGTAGAVEISPVCETVTVVTAAGTVSAKGGAGGNGGNGGIRSGTGGTGNGGNGGNGASGSNGSFITTGSDGIQTISGVLTAAKGGKGTGGTGGTSTVGSGGSGGSAGASDGGDGTINLTTSGAAINTAGATITPAAATSTAASPFCAAATATLTLKKTWANGISGDTATVTSSGFTNAATSGASVSSGNNTTTGSSVTVSAGESGTIGESFSVGSAGDYNATLACTGNATPLSGSTPGSTLTVNAADTAITCTITNTRKSATLTLKKTWANGISGDTATVTGSGFTNAATSGASVSSGNNTTTGSSVTVYAGESGTISESFSVGSAVNYTATLSCTGNATALVGNTLTVNAADTAITCTITNTQVLNPSSAATLWVGLKNSDDQGTNFDVIVQLLRNGIEIASGVALCQTGVTRNPDAAKEVTVPLSVTGSGPTSSGDVITIKVFARVGTTNGVTFCGGHSSAVGLRLYYDATTRASEAADLFLHSDGTACDPNPPSDNVTIRSLDGTTPTATSAKCQDSAAVNFAGGNVQQQIGGDWTLTVP